METWLYNEFRQVGVNFDNRDELTEYDNKYKTVRNYDDEVNYLSQAIQLTPDSEILEIGCGTGEHAIRLAPKCKRVVVSDVSELMLDCVLNKVKLHGIDNIELINSGFLNLNFRDESFDAVISQLALHHLPDFWKSVAILNISRMLKPGGVFYLLDSILSFPVQSYAGVINEVIETARKTMGEKIAEEISINIRDEYPTYDWIIEKFLVENGFRILHKIRYTGMMSLFVGVKEN